MTATTGTGYKQSDVGVIPEDWTTHPLNDLVDPQRPISYGIVQTGPDMPNGVPCLRVVDIADGRIRTTELVRTSQEISNAYRRTVLKSGDLVMPLRGKVGEVAVVDGALDGANLTRGVALLSIRPAQSGEFCHHYISWPRTRSRLAQAMNGSALQEISIATLRAFRIALPNVEYEQQAIAEALSDVDALLAGLDRLIAKKRDLKQAAMQQLLSGQIRSPGFHGDWEKRTLEASAHCLDHVRVPLNESQRAAMKGDYPYCGANGVLDYVDSYVIDDDIILMAEDGGYFDEYETRPIAYRMSGKCWVNNHAHVLKAKPDVDQGFLYYSLVHKNILPFLASGTRAKLNRSEMNKIELLCPRDKQEQSAIATVLSNMDAELSALEARRDKTQALKQAMMQELLTGRIRLV